MCWLDAYSAVDHDADGIAAASDVTSAATCLVLALRALSLTVNVVVAFELFCVPFRARTCIGCPALRRWSSRSVEN